MKSRKKKIMRLILVITIAIFGGYSVGGQETSSQRDPSSYVVRVRPKTRIVGGSRPFVEFPLSTAIGFGKRDNNYFNENFEQKMKRTHRAVIYSAKNNPRQNPIYWLMKLVRRYPGLE
ncbi:uncharacterized protein LOC103573083 [Microplitis demolitor]|uniref:uncharacterized protein LOC103573083 n=1 Tax=Microplitis demolitor TaxID=69319 RepID=UPI0004CD5445|nr:uncharacterized protein LOC103573083 [Microplitis demolitor]